MAPPPSTTKSPYTGFFQRLTKLFRSGPSIRRKVKGYDYRNIYDREVALANRGFGSVGTPFGRDTLGLGNVIGQMGMMDRMARYQEFVEAEQVPEVACALSVFADESVASDENGKCFHIYSDNPEVRGALDELFNDVMNVEYNLRFWVRNLCKFGDFYLISEVAPDHGVINVAPLPVSQVEREEGFDRKDPYAVRFRWQGGASRYLENWQVAHFRLLGSDMFYPYGQSILDPARRIIRMLIMAEDAMLTYRIARSSERRVFYIDTAGIPPNDVPTYMARAQAALRSKVVTDKSTGRLDYRNNPLSISDDIFIPTRGNNFTTKVETLPGGQNTAATEDVEYLQNKLFSALQVPKAFLGYSEDLASKASLAQLDVRFSRTVSVIQKVVIAELNKLAMIHLYAKGFDGEDLVDFDLRLSNPSTIAMQQKLELWAARFNIAGTAKEVSVTDEEWIQKNILGLTNDEISKMLNGRRKDKVFQSELESITPPQVPPEAPEPVRTDLFSTSAYEVPGARGKVRAEPDEPPSEPPSPDSLGDHESQSDSPPIKPTGFLARHKKNTSRHRGYEGRYAQVNPDFSAMLSPSQNVRLRDPYDQEFHKSQFRSEAVTLDEIQKSLFPEPKPTQPKITQEIRSVLTRFDSFHGRVKIQGSRNLISEAPGEGSDPDGGDDSIWLEVEEMDGLTEEERVTQNLQEILKDPSDDEDLTESSQEASETIALAELLEDVKSPRSGGSI